MKDGEKSGEPFEGHAILELMGHRRLAGYLRVVELAGAPFVRIDVPGEGGAIATQLYSPQAVYCITPTSEETARRVAALSRVEPVTRWELQALPAPGEDGGRPWGEAGDG